MAYVETANSYMITRNLPCIRVAFFIDVIVKYMPFSTDLPEQSYSVSNVESNHVAELSARQEIDVRSKKRRIKLGAP
jgi:hypothetical protein